MQNLRAALSQCSAMRFTNSSGGTLAADSLYKVGSVCGIVSEDVLNGAEGILITRAPSAGVILPCPAGATGVFAVGEMVYYEDRKSVV